MSSEPADPNKLRGAALPTPVRVRLRYAAFETFLDKFAPNVTRGGVFLASRTPRPVGEVFAFEVLLEGGEVALSGDGKVTWVKELDPAQPNRPHGMGVQFLRLDAPSRDAVNRMLARKAAGNPGVVRAPLPNAASGGHRSGPSGVVAPAPRIDTNVDLAAELGVDETRLRRAVDRNWLGGSRASGEIEELEALLRPEPVETVTLQQALAELPRLLDPGARRRSGAFRPLAEMFPALTPPPKSEDPDAGG
ncbi:MAG TPA: TIGR02266 family protein [Polyangia bacterium]|nr:TIGR02266 family protein [Polyangia bacterium]